MKIDTEEIKLQNLSSSSKTDRVLEKWENEGEIHRDSIRKAASEYAKLEINNKILKWIIVVVVTLLFVLLGFMIASVVLGVHITKEVTVKNGVLVSKNGNQAVIKTSTVKYHNRISLNSPSQVIDSLSTISVTVNEGIYQGVLQFDVVSYIFTPGKQLTFYGHTHIANVLPDGTVSVQSLVPMVGSRDNEEENINGAFADGTSTNTGSSAPAVEISACEHFATRLTATGNFIMTTSLNCPSLQLPLFQGIQFTGVFDGNGNVLTVDGTNNNGPIGLFDQFRGVLKNLEIEGKLEGKGLCGGAGVTLLTGAYISKVGTYASITCHGVSGSTNAAGGLFAVVQKDSATSTSSANIAGSVSQATITFNDASAHVGGLYGLSPYDTSVSVFLHNAVDATFVSSGLTDQFGFLNNNAQDSQKENNYCLTDTGLSSTFFTNCYGQERTPNLANEKNCNGYQCFDGRDTSPRVNNLNKRENYQSRFVISSTKVHPQFDNEIC